MKTHTITTFVYDELGEKEREKAREGIYNLLCNIGVVTDMMRDAAIDWLSNEGWVTEGASLEFSVSHSQGDFVAWSGTRPVGGWIPGHEVEVKTKTANTNWYPYMDTLISWDGDDRAGSLITEAVERRAEEMVHEHANKVLTILHKLDLDLIDDEEYLSEFAMANDLEFLEDGTLWIGARTRPMVHES